MPDSMRKVEAPEYLGEWPELMDEFDRLATMLCELMPENFGQPDADLLARYVTAEAIYEKFTAEVLAAPDATAAKNAQLAQDKAFKQAHSCATALGLTVTSRCKLVVPQPQEPSDDESEF